VKNFTVLLLAGASSIMAEYKIDIVFNNVAYNELCTTEWGFACYIQTPENNILFDTGSDGEILVENMHVLDINPDDIDLIVISHMHYDHIGGLERILGINQRARLFLPESAPDTLVDKLRTRRIDVTLVKERMRIADGIYSTGEIGSEGLKEQSLILDSDRGLTVITGCAHPGIVQIIEKTERLHDKSVFLVLGGFHMMRMTPEEIAGIVKRLQDLGVEHIGPSHCTGDEAIQAFKKAWADRFLDLGCGATFELQ
jgi:7,8-dihydropterin-6-yl-methyl-4-(beta-D-ribofuranosyl)aminobenzene 5'-phosphate synthase